MPITAVGPQESISGDKILIALEEAEHPLCLELFLRRIKETRDSCHPSRHGRFFVEIYKKRLKVRLRNQSSTLDSESRHICEGILEVVKRKLIHWQINGYENIRIFSATQSSLLQQEADVRKITTQETAARDLIQAIRSYVVKKTPENKYNLKLALQHCTRYCIKFDLKDSFKLDEGTIPLGDVLEEAGLNLDGSKKRATADVWA